MVAALSVSAMRRVTIFLATGAYSGYAPIAPGTAGSVVGLVLAWLVCARLWRAAPVVFLCAYAVVFALSCWIAGRAEEIFNECDCPHIVIDEVLGMVATMFLNSMRWPSLAGGFVLFRLLDIVKPFPAGLIDRRMRGGAAVMLDDLCAAVYANLILHLAARVL
jgi:phosphatidylglycerophosphatase A